MTMEAHFGDLASSAKSLGIHAINSDAFLMDSILLYDGLDRVTSAGVGSDKCWCG